MYESKIESESEDGVSVCFASNTFGKIYVPFPCNEDGSDAASTSVLAEMDALPISDGAAIKMLNAVRFREKIDGSGRSVDYERERVLPLNMSPCMRLWSSICGARIPGQCSSIYRSHESVSSDIKESREDVVARHISMLQNLACDDEAGLSASLVVRVSSSDSGTLEETFEESQKWLKSVPHTSVPSAYDVHGALLAREGVRKVGILGVVHASTLADLRDAGYFVVFIPGTDV